MRRLLRLECQKLLPYRTFHVMVGLYLTLVLGASVFAKELIDRYFARPGIRLDLFQLPDLWTYLQFLAAYLNTFLGILVITLVCNEWAFLALRQHVADGLSRFAAVASKTLLIGMLSLCVTLFIFSLGAILGTWPNEVNLLFIKQMGSSMGRFSIQTFGYLSLAGLIGFVLRRAGLAIAFYATYVTIMESIAGLLLDRWIEGISSYLPIKLLGGLLENPFGGLWGQSTGISWATIGLAGGYCLIFHGLSYIWVTRSDL